nr:LLM class flavin-dependent oxidoreductase [Phaeacidiphilus oryzae]
MTEPLHLAVALDGTGWHPASWREPGSRADQLLTAGYWADQVAEAERGLLDFVTLEDGLSLQSESESESGPGPGGGKGGTADRTDRVRGRLDAVLTASRIAPLTRRIGLVPTVVATHTEPFHLSKAIATLDYVSSGRAGVRIRISNSPQEAAHFGRRTLPADPTELLDEAADYIEVLRRLWDSWEDDAEIRDAATGRFVDREKLHYIDFEGRFFKVRGPSITPRPPQGQPLVTALAHTVDPFWLVARSADVGYLTPHDADQARALVTTVRSLREQAAPPDAPAEPLHLFGELVVLLDETPGAAADRLARLDETAGEAYRSDARVFTGTPVQLADLLLEWGEAGLSGFRLRPAALAQDLPAITRGLVPELQRRGAFRRRYEADTLRGLLGLPRPADRYAVEASA